MNESVKRIDIKEMCIRDSNIIADSIEATAMATPFDAMVFIPNCDKVVPGMLIAAARLNIPSVFVSGGAMLAGVHKGKKIGLRCV